MLYQLSYEASLEAGQERVQFIPVIWREWDVYMIEIIYMNCRYRVQLKVILTVVKQLKQLQRKPRKKLLRLQRDSNPWPHDHNPLFCLYLPDIQNSLVSHFRWASDPKPYTDKKTGKIKSAHRMVAKQPLVLSCDSLDLDDERAGTDGQRYNLRKLIELPHHLIKAEMWTEFVEVCKNLPYDNLYSANSMWHVQMRFTISMHEIEPKALKAPLAAAIRFMYDL